MKIAHSKNYQRWLLPLLVLIIIIAIIYSALSENFHVVIPDKVYRSAQLSPTSIKLFTHLKHIKTIINLRGVNLDQAWYQQEMKVSHQLHLQHYDIALNSTHRPTQQQLAQLTQILQAAPKPILVHCLSGSDRSGLASAMSLILLKNSPLHQAEQQFSWRYFVTSDKTVGKQVFASYENWLNQNHIHNDKAHFLQWVHSTQ